MNANIIERRNAEYTPLIESFKKEIKGLNLEGISAPHLPGVGESYEESKYKFAFCGWSTCTRYSINDFIQMDAGPYLGLSDDCLNNYKYLGWSANWHDSFWGFVVKFFAMFYKTTFKELLVDEKNIILRSILKSFVWMETNSIKRIEVTSKNEGIHPNTWSIVKQANDTFNDLKHVINCCVPNVVFILPGGVTKEYFLNDGSFCEIFGVDVSFRNNVLHLQNAEMQYDYYYLRNSDTHLFKLPHPRWMGIYSGLGIDKYVEALYKDINTYHIWDVLPSSPKDWKETKKRK